MIKKLGSDLDSIWNKGKKNIDELFWFTGGQFIVLILNFLSIKILAKLGTEEYGIYSLIITISFLIGSVYYGPVQQGFMRFYAVYTEHGKKDLFLSLMVRFVSRSTILFLMLSLIICFLLHLIIGLPGIWFILSSAVFLIFLKASEFFNVSFNIIRKRKENSIIQSLEKVFVVLFLLILVSTDSFSLLSVLAGFSVIYLVFAFLKFQYFRRITGFVQDIDTSTEKKIIKDIWIYVFPFVVWGISGWLQLNGEKWIIAERLSASDVGVYAIMVSLTSIMIGIPTNLLSEFFSPIIYQQFSEINNPEKIRPGLRYINMLILLVVFLTIISTAVAFFWGDTLILLISYPEYTVYSQLLPLLAFGTGIFLIAQTMSILGLALNRPKIYMLPKILIGIIAVSLNYFMISYYGIEGVAYAVLSAGLIYFLHIYLLNRKLLSEIGK